MLFNRSYLLIFERWEAESQIRIGQRKKLCKLNVWEKEENIENNFSNNSSERNLQKVGRPEENIRQAKGYPRVR